MRPRNKPFNENCKLNTRTIRRMEEGDSLTFSSLSVENINRGMDIVSRIMRLTDCRYNLLPDYSNGKLTVNCRVGI